MRARVSVAADVWPQLSTYTVFLMVTGWLLLALVLHYALVQLTAREALAVDKGHDEPAAATGAH